MPDLLETLYQTVHESEPMHPDVKTSLERVVHLESSLLDQAEGEIKRLFAQYIDAQAELMNQTALQTFRQGYRAGESMVRS